MSDEVLSNVHRRLVDAEDRELARIERDLDDDVGQRSALLAVNFEQLSRDVPSPTLNFWLDGRIAEAN